MTEMNCPTLTFHIREGEALARQVSLAERVIKIGKLPSSHLRIEHDDVSRMHAVIETIGEGDDVLVHVIDLGSATGTFVNGKRVNKARVESGDVLGFGRVRVAVQIDASGTSEAVSAAIDASAHAGGGRARPPAPEPRREPATPAAMAMALAKNQKALEPATPPRAALPNPFAMPIAAQLVSASATPSSASTEDHAAGAANVRWGIAASGPPVNPADVETTATAAEVVLMWGDESVLHVAHLSPPRAFFIGERAPGREVDYALGSELLGVERMPVVLEVGGQIAVVVPDGATCELSVGAQTRSDAELAASGVLTPSPGAELTAARQLLLPAGATARVRFKGLCIVTRATSAGRAVGTDVAGPRWQSHLWTALSLGVHASLILMFYFMPPSSASLSLDLVDDRSRLIDYLVDVSEVVDEEPPVWLETTPEASTEGGTGERAEGDTGSMGDESAEPSTSHYGVEGPSDNPDPHLAREEALDAARSAGAIGALAAITGSWASPTSPYGADTALGTDPMSALGALMGDSLGSNFGFGGLGPNGTGRGAGGLGRGTIGLGRFGGIGHGGGPGRGDGYGDGIGLPTHGPVSHPPRITPSDPVVAGGLSREVIRRVVRRHINEVRFCYEQELRARPDLAGRVTVAFIIAANGAVTTANVSATSLSNARVESCIATAVHRWTFPAPDGGGAVGVSYPFVLESAE